MKIIVANWKMNLNPEQAGEYLTKLKEEVRAGSNSAEVVLAPTFLALDRLAKEQSSFSLAAQNCSTLDDGSLTGEVSAEQMRDLVDYVIVGHSERRQFFAESDDTVRAKVEAVLRNKLKPILCVGERNVSETESTLRRQLTTALEGLECESMIVAYEPVYAIGASQPANNNQIHNATALIRKIINEISPGLGVKILYGGSVDEKNAAEILSIQGIDGLLVGRASLDAVKFAKIIEIARG